MEAIRLLRRLEEADHLMLEQAMAALQVHHVARIGDDHVPLIRVRQLLDVTACNRNGPGLQSSRLLAHIICLYHPYPAHISCH
jgi:hypothetical protein